LSNHRYLAQTSAKAKFLTNPSPFAGLLHKGHLFSLLSHSLIVCSSNVCPHEVMIIGDVITAKLVNLYCMLSDRGYIMEALTIFLPLNHPLLLLNWLWEISERIVRPAPYFVFSVIQSLFYAFHDFIWAWSPHTQRTEGLFFQFSHTILV